MKEIPGFPGYFADETGVIWTTKRKGGNDRAAGQRSRPIPLSVHRNRKGYCAVNLDIGGKVHARLVHRLVLEAFVGTAPQKMDGCHYPDRDKSNNRLDNLRWDTHEENIRDNYRDRSVVTEKACRRCGQTKPLCDFYKDTRASDGHKTECKPCHSRISIESRDPDRRRAYNREFMRRSRARSAT